MSTLKRWLAASSALKQATLEFLEASKALDTTTRESSVTDSTEHSIEMVANEVEDCIDSVPLAQTYITRSQTLLHGLLNRSVARAPINQIGTETLSQIFAMCLADSPCMAFGNQYDVRTNMMLVCVRWYGIILNNPLFWSHIDITMERWIKRRNLSIPRRWRNLSGTVPLHIHIEGSFQHSTVAYHPLEDSFRDEVVSFLEQDVQFVTSLVAYGPKAASVSSLLLGTYPIDLWKSLKNVDLGHFESTYTDIPTLPQFENLLELSLQRFNVHTHTVLDDVSIMLSKCPNLNTLRLTYVRPDGGYYFLDVPNLSYKPTVCAMSHLKLIELDQNTIFILWFLSTGGLELDFRLNSWYSQNADNATLESFFSRSKVVTLTVPGIPGQRLLPLLAKHLHYLSGLRYVDHFSGLFGRIEFKKLIPHGLRSWCPNLQFICFVQFMLNHEAIQELQELLAMSKLSRVAFLDCRFKPRSLDSRPFNSRSPTPDMRGEPGVPEDPHPRLTSLAQRVVTRESVPNEIYHGGDLFVQEMMKSD
ncbi:pyrolysin [Ceratobasidium sp. AG-Ba]|nr:pyrolysin [Ceratobasidium sp. AG-Ba]